MSNDSLSKEERKRLKAQIKADKLQSQTKILSQNFKEPITILCVRFGNLYGREYVERLRNMISRNISIPYRFCCLTDDNHPISGVDTLYQPNAGYKKGWWHKVHMFDPNLNINGRILYFDLDVVVHDNIDKLVVNYNKEFLGIRDFNRKFFPSWQYLNSSVMSWIHGSQSFIWKEYIKDKHTAHRLQGDQDWIWKVARSNIKFWPEDWIQSYKWETRSRSDLILSNGKRKFKTIDDNIKPDPRCCVSVFHGDPKPQEVQDKFVVENWQ